MDKSDTQEAPMDTSGWLLMRCNGEFDTIFVAAYCTNKLLATVKSRQQALISISKGSDQSGISGASYWHDVEAYEMPDMGTILVEDGLFDQFESQDWVMVDSRPNDSELGEPVRIEACELNIPVIGNFFYWSFVPKHGSTSYETPGISTRDVQEYFDGNS